METTKKTKQLPPYLIEIRDEIIRDLAKRGIPLQGIADLFSTGITKARVHQLTKQTNGKSTNTTI